MLTQDHTKTQDPIRTQEPVETTQNPGPYRVDPRCRILWGLRTQETIEITEDTGCYEDPEPYREHPRPMILLRKPTTQDLMRTRDPGFYRKGTGTKQKLILVLWWLRKLSIISNPKNAVFHVSQPLFPSSLDFQMLCFILWSKVCTGFPFKGLSTLMFYFQALRKNVQWRCLQKTNKGSHYFEKTKENLTSFSR